jgi:hypothetical protein
MPMCDEHGKREEDPSALTARSKTTAMRLRMTNRLTPRPCLVILRPHAANEDHAVIAEGSPPRSPHPPHTQHTTKKRGDLSIAAFSQLRKFVPVTTSSSSIR